MRISIIALLFVLVSSFSFAQELSVTGRVIDKAENSPMISAFVILNNLATGSRKTAITDHSGNFIFENITSGAYRLDITYLGFQDFQKNIEVMGQNLQLGTLYMGSSDTQLDEVIVQEKLPLATQDGDTTSFNANAFKTNPDASAEDLIQKMPGVVIQNGKVQAQGEDVKEVLVDGRPFFGNDPNAALKNLPAEIIEKIQVFDQQSDQSQFTGFDNGETTKTINIVTKKDMRSGQFGRVYAGYGYEDKYKAGGTINFFDGDKRISIIGQSNNVNIQNFSSEDLVGVVGSNRRGRRGGGGKGRGGSGGSAADFLVDQAGGISTTHALGLNYSDKWGKKVDVSGSYFFNKSENNVDELINREYIDAENTNQFYTEDNISTTDNMNHRLNMRLTFQIDSSNSIIMRPRLSFQANDGFSNTFGKTTLGFDTLNLTNNDYFSDLKGLNFSNNMLWRHRFKKRSRTFSINLNTTYNENIGESFLYSQDSYFTEMAFSDTLDQFSDLTTNGWKLSANASYTEPIGKGMLMLSYQSSVQQDDADKQTFDYSKETEAYEALNTSLSNVFESEAVTHSGRIGYNYRTRNAMFMVRASVQNTTLNKDQTFPTLLKDKRDFFNVLPMAMYRLKISDKTNFRIFYRSRTNLPTIEQLQNVLDNSNPLQLSIGNPKLDQSVRHSVFLRYQGTNTEKATVFYFLIGGEYATDYISNATYLADSRHPIFDELEVQRGTQLSQPTNLDGYYSLRSFITYGIPLTSIKSNLNFNINGNYNRTPGLINDNLNYSNNTNAGLGLTLSSNISEKVDFTITSQSNYNLIKNTLQEELDNNYFSQLSQLKLNLIFGKGFVFQTNIAHQFYDGLSEDLDQNYVLVSASIGKKLFKNERGDIRLTVFDLLDQNQSLKRNVTDVYYEDVYSQVLQRYVMLTFSYKLRHFATKGTVIPDPTKNERRDRRGRGRW